MFCTNCGARLEQAHNFCSACGAAAVVQTTASDLEADIGGEVIDLEVAPEFYDMVSAQHEAERNWRAALGEKAIRFAEQWFGAPSVNTAALFSAVDPELGQALIDQGAWEGNVDLSASFVLLPHGFETGRVANPRVDDMVSWTESAYRQQIVALTADLGINVAQEGFGLVGWWPTKSGGTSVHFASVMRGSEGSEYLHWYSTPLASVGTMIENDVARIALTASIPSMLQSAVYLAESPMPLDPEQLFIGGGRPKVLFGATGSSRAVPIPVTTLIMTDGSSDAHYYAVDRESSLIEPRACGGAVMVGYAIDLNGNDYVTSRGIQVAVASLVRLAGILEDGYLAHADGDLAFDRIVWSQAATMSHANQAWIPTSIA